MKRGVLFSYQKLRNILCQEEKKNDNCSVDSLLYRCEKIKKAWKLKIGTVLKESAQTFAIIVSAARL